ncbi:MAG TPA: right-handed parallel beta-helix repeat-containing protein [Bryobacteraceae bacterium]|nr:right-handed parallel beta-helix repeat-containing protein [Bryobacteraceae bacterium]
MIRKTQRNFSARAVLVFGSGLLALAGQSAMAATLCVNPTGASGCQTTIGAAVSAAAQGDVVQVAAGTYKEDVNITKTIALIGAGSATTIIDATGLANGIVIDGTAGGVLGGVVSGFTVENANLQGILVQNASGITIWNNEVQNNDKNLNATAAPPSCPGLPTALQSGEAFDCGEGIHLNGVDHSVVSNNVVQHNAGGILISDDTGANHDNVISGNMVSDNGYDCGITLASHSGMGVYHNTVTGNQSLRNGLLANGTGAGVGIYAAGPGDQAYSNMVINNQLIGNGLPGVAMHNHAAAGVAGVPAGAPPINFNDNVIVGNTISDNGPDTADTATPGSAGINLATIGVANGTVIAENAISGQAIAVAVRTPGETRVFFNNFTAGTGVLNTGAGIVNATENWWGCLGGPGSPACASSMGENATTPFLTSPFSASALPSGPGSVIPPMSGVVTVVVTAGGATSPSNTFQAVGNVVMLNASQSSSTAAGPLSFAWAEVSGYPPVQINGASTATPAVTFSVHGTFQFTVTVTDSTGSTGTATVTVENYAL